VHIKYIKIRKFLEKLFTSLTAKIAVAMSVVFLIAGGSFAFFANYTGYRMLEKGAQTQAHVVAEFGKAILEYIMLQGENKQLQSAFNRIITSNHASDVLILNDQGDIVLRASSEVYPSKLPIDQFKELPEYPGEKFLLIHEGDKIYEYIITPIVKKSDCYKCHSEPISTKGFLGVKISMNDIRSVAMGHRATNIIMTIVTFVGLGGVLFMALLFVVLRPVKKLQTQIGNIDLQIDRYEKGERVQFGELVVTDREDEITTVIKAFNRLIQRLNEANEKIRELHQNQMEHADRLATTGEMAAGIAHEIKNPIAGVLGALHVFDDEMKDGDERKEIFAEMIAQLERVNYTINDLLSYARPAKPEFVEVDIVEAVRRTVSILSAQRKQFNAEIRTSLTDDKILIYADKKQIQQILWNVTLNALQALDEIGLVEITISTDDTNVIIEVKDTGRGIPTDQIGYVFQPFFTTKHKGTGLGMTITKRIIEQHRGEIQIKSEVNEGTIITIVLPKKQI
jgi:signal transduction histidine kinase